MDLGFLALGNTPHCDIEDEHQGLASDPRRSALRFRFEECTRGTTWDVRSDQPFTERSGDMVYTSVLD
jgi:hypothetical protein